jgi:pyruvate formate lyase activating enzyme
VTYEQSGGKIYCKLCPHGCVISDGGSGICRVRENRGGKLALPYHGILSGTAMDPVEKKPLYHFYPGKQILSVGFYGCNFKCPFCQNYQISQRVVDGLSETDPEVLVETASQRGSIGIAYTYSEPLVHFEYILATAKIAKGKGLKNVLVTNGYLNPEPAAELFEYIDAANVDLKSSSPGFYTEEIKGKLTPVLAFISQAAPVIALEVTTLVIPGKNDKESEISSIADFISAINPDIPLHLSCYYPTYKYTVGATPPELVFRHVQTAREKLNYVYAGNTGTRENNTLCPDCKSILIRRKGYSTTIEGLSEGVCTQCGKSIPIVTD